MLNKIWRWFTSLFCNHQWRTEAVAIRHLQFFWKQWCPVCGRTRFKRYTTGKCPYCGRDLRLRSSGTDEDGGYLYQEMCVNNECPNFMGGGRDEA